jgi:hypothetical protein
VNGAGDAVLELEVHLRDNVLGEDGGVRDITWEEAVLVVSSQIPRPIPPYIPREIA